MKKKGIYILAAAVLVCFAVILLSSGKERYSGTYRAVNPPVDTGEMVIESVQFNGKQLIMQSGDTQQSSEYAIQNGRLILRTEFGDFAFPFEEIEHGFKIDGIEYVKD